MRGGRLIPTRNSGPLGVFRRGRIARPGRSRSFRGFYFPPGSRLLFHLPLANLLFREMKKARPLGLAS